MCGIGAMKEALTRDVWHKDCRGENGWRVDVRVTDNVQVSHTRREQSIDSMACLGMEPSADPTLDHFEFSWTLHGTSIGCLEVLIGCFSTPRPL